MLLLTQSPSLPPLLLIQSPSLPTQIHIQLPSLPLLHSPQILQEAGWQVAGVSCSLNPATTVSRGMDTCKRSRHVCALIQYSTVYKYNHFAVIYLGVVPTDNLYLKGIEWRAPGDHVCPCPCCCPCLSCAGLRHQLSLLAPAAVGDGAGGSGRRHGRGAAPGFIPDCIVRQRPGEDIDLHVRTALLCMPCSFCGGCRR